MSTGQTHERHMQQRGVLRREKLLTAARQLLGEQEVGKISFSNICERAEVPRPSAYHFFPDINAIYLALTESNNANIENLLTQPVEQQEVRSWQHLLELLVDRLVDHYETHPDLAKLVYSGKIPTEVRLSERTYDHKYAQITLDLFQQHFVLPPGRDWIKTFFIATEIVDTILSLSFLENQSLVPEMIKEAKRAAFAYLRLYVGDYPSRQQPSPAE